MLITIANLQRLFPSFARLNRKSILKRSRARLDPRQGQMVAQKRFPIISSYM